MNKKYFTLGAILVFLIFVTALFLYIEPDELVGWIGVKNTYLVAFLIAAAGGISMFTSATFFTVIATFAAGGANTILLGIAGGLGIFISDSIFFYLAAIGREALSEKWQSRVEAIAKRAEAYPLWLILLCVYLYLGFSPLPNDILMIALVAAGFRYRTVAPVILAGSITIATMVAYISKLGFFT